MHRRPATCQSAADGIATAGCTEADMTPTGWMTDDFAAWGAAWMFGGLLLALPIGVLIGRWKGPEAGIGSGMLVWGLGNITISAMTVLFMQVDSKVLHLKPLQCEPGTDSRNRPLRTLTYGLQRPGEPARVVTTLCTRGLCPEGSPQADALRVRTDALASGAPRIAGEWADDDKPLAVMSIWGAFGAFALLAAGLLLGHWRQTQSGRPAPDPATPRPVAAWRSSMGNTLAQLGGLVFLAAFVIPWFLDGSTERALQFAMRCVASAMGMWVLAGLLARTMAWGAAFFLLFFGATALGVAELLRRG
jgi:hypothetical protein